MNQYSDLSHRFVHLNEISYSSGKLQFYQLWRNFCNWPVAGSQHIYPMHTYTHTYSIFTYMHVCLLPLWSNDSRFCLVVPYNSYLLLTVYIRRSLPFVFFLSLTPLLTKGLFTQFQFLWHCMVLIYVYLCLSWQCHSVTWRWQRGVWATSYVRQDKTPGALVCLRLSLGTCPVNSLRSLPQICMRPFCLSL